MELEQSETHRNAQPEIGEPNSLLSAADMLVDHFSSEIEAMTELQIGLDREDVSDTLLRRHLAQIKAQSHQGHGVATAFRSALGAWERTDEVESTPHTERDAVRVAVNQWTERWRQAADSIGVDLKIIASLLDRLAGDSASSADLERSMLGLIQKTVHDISIEVDLARPPHFVAGSVTPPA